MKTLSMLMVGLVLGLAIAAQNPEAMEIGNSLFDSIRGMI